MYWDNLYTSCTLCPRNCGVDRLAGQRGFCGETADLRIAVANIHRGEEPPLTGLGGSGTIFITGCTLGCAFCQNWQVSHSGMGRVVKTDEFAAICLALQRAGAENINIVTGSHAIPAIITGITQARKEGLQIPILWNSSSYESAQVLLNAEPYIDVFLPDLKTLDNTFAGRYFNAADYPEAATKAILAMISMKELRYGPCRKALEAAHTGAPVAADWPLILESGVVIRHLVLPDRLEDTRAVLQWFAEHAQGKALISVMTQYTPVKSPKNRFAKELPDRYVGEREFEIIQRWFEEFDIEDGFYQELVPDDAWLPDFMKTNPFSSELSVPIWHWEHGFIPNDTPPLSG
ncbi:radical SAM protein [Gracilinema caldarium]|uniref:Radical SAM domain protein n=1 Tax=Gracilinema caldarium (strain ATCC 51460 / DSM 7334 / H1) TaxID=744872 RepID=F8EY50_GRAC1|nr:radical SAM protein [Gracilinema caldarium]AEJ20711.1 Radical SAM domain protein [Gracilinema caldarium DSM 7334]